MCVHLLRKMYSAGGNTNDNNYDNHQVNSINYNGLSSSSPMSENQFSTMLTQCPTCSSLMSSQAYESHRYVHDSTDRSFMCERGCMDMFFETADELEMHRKFMHTSLICETQIKRTYLSGITNGSHILKRRPQPLESCTICKRNIPMTNMERHMTLHSPTGRPFACARGCSRTYFVTNKRLSDHNRRVHDTETRSTTCAVCGTITWHMHRHMRMHDSTGRPFQCENGCVHSYFETKKALCTHRHTHHPASITSRIICAKNMEQHMICHSPTGRPFACEIGCPNTFSSTSRGMEQHKREVHNIKAETTCTVCGVDDVKPNMTQHMLTHDPTGRPFECTDGCVKTFFKTQNNHGQHRRKIHKITSEMPKNDCTVCGKTCASSKMSQHMTVHNNEGRLFMCNKGCKETYFSTKKYLRDHHSEIHRDSALQNDETAPTRLESFTTIASAATVAPSTLLSVEPILNTPTVQTRVKLEPTSLRAKRARLTSTSDYDHGTMVSPSENIEAHPSTGNNQSPSSSLASSESELSSDDSEDDDWSAPKTRKSKRTVLKKST